MGKEFAIAEGKRIEITNEQAKQIRDMYKQIEKEFGERARILSNKSNISSIMREQYLKDFQKDLQDRIVVLNSQLEGTIKDNMLEVAKSVTSCNESMLHEMGFGGVFTSNFYIPQDAVNAVITGKLYEGKWNLSRAIWSDNQKKINDINSIVSKGMAENKSTYEIAKDLERYVNPQARKEWSWSKVYPGTSKKIDYNAQRLARTMVSHAYQEAFVLNTKDNPFIESYRWLASNSDRTCELCEERDGQIYDKDSLPLDHPNGMCTFEIVREKSYEEIAKDLRNWVDGTGDSELNDKLDNYASTLGYNVKEWTANTPQVQNAPHIVGEDLSKLNATQTIEWFNENSNYQEWKEEIFDREIDETIYKYSGEDYSMINDLLRKGEFNPVSKWYEESDVRQEIKELDEAISLFNLKENLVVYRASDSSMLGRENMSLEEIKKLVGTNVIDKGYTSASTVKELPGEQTVGGKVKYIIDVPQGQGNGAYIAKYSENPQEREFLMARDGNYLVNSVEEDENGLINVYMSRL